MPETAVHANDAKTDPYPNQGLGFADKCNDSDDSATYFAAGRGGPGAGGSMRYPDRTVAARFSVIFGPKISPDGLISYFFGSVCCRFT